MGMNRCVASAVVVAGIALAPSNVSAQIGFESLFSGINDINVFFSCWSVKGAVERTSDCFEGRNGYGVEIAWTLSSIPLPGGRPVVVQAGWDTVGRVDKSVDGGPVETTLMLERRAAATQSSRSLLIEFAFGYGQFSGFNSVMPDLELRGTVREIPSVTAYGTFRDDSMGFLGRTLKPYIGIRSGLMQLNNLQIFDRTQADTLSVATGTGTAFELGAAGGLVLSVLDDHVHLFYEWATHIRKFSSVQWDAQNKRIRDEYPRELTFSGPSQTFGVQITLRER